MKIFPQAVAHGFNDFDKLKVVHGVGHTLKLAPSRMPEKSWRI
jgi:hypothetical protein